MLKLGEVGNNSKDFEDFLSTKNTKLPLFLTQKWENYEFPIFGHHPNCKESHDSKKTKFFLPRIFVLFGHLCNFYLAKQSSMKKLSVQLTLSVNKELVELKLSKGSKVQKAVMRGVSKFSVLSEKKIVRAIYLTKNNNRNNIR